MYYIIIAFRMRKILKKILSNNHEKRMKALTYSKLRKKTEEYLPGKLYFVCGNRVYITI